MSNPWETKNPWGKGSKEWNRWMAPELVEETVGKRQDPKFEMPFDEVNGISYIDEYAISLYSEPKYLKEEVRLIRRADGVSVFQKSIPKEERPQALLAKSKILKIPSPSDQMTFALDLLRRSVEKRIELLAYVAYNFELGRLSFIEEKDVSKNTLTEAFSNHSAFNDRNPKLWGPAYPTKILYVKDNRSEQIIGYLHTHPSGGNSTLSTWDLSNNQTSGLVVMAIQSGKVLYVGIGPLASEQTHEIPSGDFDFMRYSLEQYFKTRGYAG